MNRSLQLSIDTFATRRPFVIARGARSSTEVLTATLRTANAQGWGECVPYRHYGETLESVRGQIEAKRRDIEHGVSRQELLTLLPAGAARNAVDAALWDLEAKESGVSAWSLAGHPRLERVRSVYTLSLGDPQDMAAEARTASRFPVLKAKLDGTCDEERIAAVRQALPSARLIVDANESWRPGDVAARLASLAELGVEMVEQPLPPDIDDMLAGIEHPVRLCADESFHTLHDLERVKGRYEVVNLKLDKTGGLTHALVVRQAAQEAGLEVMVGCMLSSSLSIAPALVLAQGASYVDVDGPYLLAEDRDPPLSLSDDGWVGGNPRLWGGAPPFLDSSLALP